MRRAWLAFAATLVLVLPARIYTVLRYLDPRSGFYTDGGGTVGAVSAALALGILLTAFYGWRDSAARAGGEPVRAVAAAAFGALAGIFVLVQSVVGIGSAPAAEGLVFFRIFSVAGIFAGAVLVATAYDLATGGRVIGGHPLLALVPPVWGCLFLVLLFITYSAVVNQVENVYHTCTVVFLLLFLFTQAKLFTGIESAKSGKMIVVVGLPAALLALSTGVPSCVQFFSEGRTPGAVPIGLHLANIVLAFYIVAFLRALERSPLRPAETRPRPDPSPDRGEREASAGTGNRPPETDDPLAACAGSLRDAFCSEKKFVDRTKSPFYPEADPGEREDRLKY